jgi:hypothetical protein
LPLPADTCLPLLANTTASLLMLLLAADVGCMIFHGVDEHQQQYWELARLIWLYQTCALNRQIQ